MDVKPLKMKAGHAHQMEATDTVGVVNGGTGLATVGANTMLYASGLDTLATTPLTAAGRALLDDADAAAQRTTLGLVIGTDVQAYDAGLLSLAALPTVADRVAYSTAADTWAETPLTAFGRSLIDDADASAGRTTLGLGTAAVEAASAFAAASHAHAASDITSGQLALARGGTAADLSATGGTGQFLRQSSAGAAITVSAIAHADLGSGGGSGTKYLRDDMTWEATSAFAAASHAHAASDITSGTLVLERGGTEADLSATGPGALVQTSAGAAVTVETLDETRGGTAQTTYATGDVLYASGTDTLARLAVGTDGHVLTLASGVPTWAAAAAGVTDHGSLTGLADDDHTQYALLLGRSGGQTLIGGTASGDDLTLQSTSHATRGHIQVNDPIVISGSTADPASTVRYIGTNATSDRIQISAPSGGSVRIVNASAATPQLLVGSAGVAMGISGNPARALEVRSTSAQQRWSYDGSNYAEITVNSTGDLVFSQSTSTYSLNICGTLGSSSTNCVVIGRSASVPASSDKCTVVGYANTVTGTGRRVAFGSGNTVTDGSLAGYPQAALGVGNTCSEGYATVVGHSCSISSGGHSSFVGGRACSTAYDSNVIIGYNCIGGANFSILLGRGVTNTAAYQFVAGSGSYPMTNVFFGGGVTHATPTAWTLNGTGGAGTNIAGGALQIAGGKGTGNAAGGSVKIQASTAGASGTTLQTLATVAEFGASGNVGIGASVVSDVRLATSYTVTTDGAYRGIRSTLSNSGATSTSNYAIIGTLTLSGTTAITGTNAAIYGSIILNQSGGSYSSGAAVSLRGFTSQTGTTSITTAYGISGSGGISSSGGITTFAAIQASSPTLSSTGVISNNYGVNIADQGDATLVTTSYALRIGTQTNSATKSWAIGSAATQDSFLAGALMIGAKSAPARMLHVISTSAQLRIGYDTGNYFEFSLESTGLTAGTTKTTPGTVDKWIKIVSEDGTYYVPAYSSTTS